jgi:hypothetical protein
MANLKRAVTENNGDAAPKLRTTAMIPVMGGVKRKLGVDGCK